MNKSQCEKYPLNYLCRIFCIHKFEHLQSNKILITKNKCLNCTSTIQQRGISQTYRFRYEKHSITDSIQSQKYKQSISRQHSQSLLVSGRYKQFSCFYPKRCKAVTIKKKFISCGLEKQKIYSQKTYNSSVNHSVIRLNSKLDF